MNTTLVTAQLGTDHIFELEEKDSQRWGPHSGWGTRYYAMRLPINLKFPDFRFSVMTAIVIPADKIPALANKQTYAQGVAFQTLPKWLTRDAIWKSFGCTVIDPLFSTEKAEPVTVTSVDAQVPIEMVNKFKEAADRVKAANTTLTDITSRLYQIVNREYFPPELWPKVRTCLSFCRQCGDAAFPNTMPKYTIEDKITSVERAFEELFQRKRKNHTFNNYLSDARRVTDFGPISVWESTPPQTDYARAALSEL